MYQTTRIRMRGALAISSLLLGLLAGGCGEDPMGPDNRLALMALGKCRHAQALQLADNAIARGNEHNVHRGWALKAAILRDMDDTRGAEAIYPEIAEAWETAKGRTLTEARRERDIGLYLDVAHAERQVNGLGVDCSNVPEAPVAAPQPTPPSAARTDRD